MDTKFKLPTIQITHANLYSSSDFGDENEQDAKKTVARRLWRKASEALALPLLHVKFKAKQKYHMSTVKDSSNADDNFIEQAAVTRRVGGPVRNTHTIPFYSFQRDLLAKFRMAVRITVFCSRKFKEHCLR